MMMIHKHTNMWYIYKYMVRHKITNKTNYEVKYGGQRHFTITVSPLLSQFLMFFFSPHLYF